MRLKNILLILGLVISASSLACAETHLVQMRNTDKNNPHNINLFAPAILQIDKGDSVTFVPSEPGHNSASKKGMIPKNATPWNGALNEEITVTFDKDGTYGYICLPHIEMGMVGLILVGDYHVNYADAKKVRQRGGAKKAFRKLFKQIESTIVN